jgi:hypothetical protein
MGQDRIMIKHAMINYCRVRKRSAHAPSILLFNKKNQVQGA